MAIGLCLAMAGMAQAQAPQEPLRPEVLAQIAALQQEKASRTPAEQKISSRLLYALRLQRGESLPLGISLRLPELKPDAGGPRKPRDKTWEVARRRCRACGDRAPSSAKDC